MPEENQGNKSSFWYGVTNPKWLSIKMQYFLLNAGIGAFIAYMVPFYKSLGLTTAQIGIIEFVSIVIGAVCGPIIGTIADKSGRHSIVVAVCALIFLVPITSFVFFTAPPKESHHVKVNFTTSELQACGANTMQRLSNTTEIFLNNKNKTISRLNCHGLHLAPNISLAFKLEPKSTVSSNNCSVFILRELDNDNFPFTTTQSDCNVEFPEHAPDNSRTFLWVCVLRAISAISLTPSVALSDSIAYLMLGHGNHQLWGQQRMFASLGWGLAGGILGICLHYFDTFKICFLTVGTVSVLSMFVALFWLPKRLGNQQQQETEEHPSFGQALRRVAVTPIFWITFIITVTSGMLFSVIQVVWAQHLLELGIPKMFFGITSAVICGLEIPSFFLGGALANKIGEGACFMIMYFAYIIRMGGNAFLTPSTVWLALPIETMHLFCFAIFFSAMTRTAAKIAPPGTCSTIQTFFATAYFGFGSGVGVVTVSLIYHQFGRYYAFLIYASFALFCLLVLLIVYLAYFRKALLKLSQEKVKKTEETVDIPMQNNPLISSKLPTKD